MRNIQTAGLQVPKGYWWLPTLNASGEVIWPLRKAYGWMYNSVGTSKTRFHFPDSEPGAQGDPGHRLLENATRWSAGSVLPSWIKLSENLNDSFSAMATTQREEHRRVLDQRTQENFRLVLFMARFSTAVFKEIKRHYGAEFTGAVVKDLERQDRRMKRQLAPMTTALSDYTRRIGPPSQDWQDRFWHHQVVKHEVILANQVKNAYAGFVDAQLHRNAIGCSKQAIRRYITACGAFFVHRHTGEVKYNALRLCPDGFGELLNKGRALKNSATPPLQVDAFRREVEEKNLMPHLEWLVHWVQAAYHYHREEYAEALKHFEKAFSQAKYTAGESQYLLVNQYMECCAKNGKRGQFNRAHAWARYLEIPCRWMRGSSSDDDVEFAYEMLSMVRYPRL